jgi:AbrB family looped-hinge helix DNA binding protein
MMSDVREDVLMPDIYVGKRAQLVIPAEIRRRLDIREGDTLRLEVDEQGRLVLEPLPRDPVARLRQAGARIFDGVDGVEEQRRLRAEWER